MDENIKVEFIEAEEMFEIVNEDGDTNGEPVFVFCGVNEESNLQPIDEGAFQTLFILNGFPDLIFPVKFLCRNPLFGRRRRGRRRRWTD